MSAAERERVPAAVARGRAQEDRHASEESYRAIVETANEGIWLIDRQAQTLVANARLAEILGTTIDDVLARTVLDFVFEQDRPLAQERMPMISCPRSRRRRHRCRSCLAP